MICTFGRKKKKSSQKIEMVGIVVVFRRIASILVTHPFYVTRASLVSQDSASILRVRETRDWGDGWASSGEEGWDRGEESESIEPSDPEAGTGEGGHRGGAGPLRGRFIRQGSRPAAHSGLFLTPIARRKDGEGGTPHPDTPGGSS